MSRISSRTFAAGVLLVGIVLATPSVVSAYTADTTNPMFKKWSLSLECRSLGGWSHKTEAGKYGGTDRERTYKLGRVTSRVNPTPAEIALIEAAKADCAVWLTEVASKVRAAACKKASGGGYWMQYSESASFVESTVISTQSHRPYKYDIPISHSYYNQRFGMQTRTALDDSSRWCG